MLRLYRAPRSTNCERVLLALGHKRLEAEMVWIDYADRTPVERVSGQPLVPVVEIDGEVVLDSRRIVERLEELHPEPTLFPQRAAEARVFIEWFDEVWKRPPNEIEHILGLPETDIGAIERLAARMDRWLDLLESLLGDGRDHLMGDFGAADCVAYPFLKYAAGRDPADDELFHRILDQYQSLEGRPRLAAWIERVRARPGAY